MIPKTTEALISEVPGVRHCDQGRGSGRTTRQLKRLVIWAKGHHCRCIFVVHSREMARYAANVAENYCGVRAPEWERVGAFEWARRGSVLRIVAAGMSPVTEVGHHPDPADVLEVDHYALSYRGSGKGVGEWLEWHAERRRLMGLVP